MNILNKNQHVIHALTRGFTLIELLIVIAIIGILSSVVITSVTSARTQAFDAKVKGQLSNIRNAAELYYGSRFNYGPSTLAMGNVCSSTPPTAGTMFADTSTNLAQLSISGNYPVGENTIVCNSNGSAYAVGDNLSATGTYWCIDSLGRSTATSGPVVAGVTLTCK